MKFPFNPAQIHRIFDISLRNTYKHNKDALSLIIGANDGITDDTLSGYTLGFNWKAIYVEPLPEHIAKLKQNISKSYKSGRARIAEVALSEIEGDLDFAYIPDDVITKNNLDPNIKGMSGFYPPRNGFASDPVTKVLFDQYHVKTKIPVIPISKLCEEYYIDHIDYIQCDTEGHDYDILKHFNFQKYKPKMLKVEIGSIDNDTQIKFFKLFADNNYTVAPTGHQDAIAIHNDHLDYLKKNKRWAEVLLLEDEHIESPQNFDNDVDTDNYITIDRQTKKKNLTIVTGLWDIKRDTLSNSFNRSFQTYLDRFEELLKIEHPMVIFTESKLVPFIESRRSMANTRIFVKEVDDLKRWFAFYEQVQNIRNNPEWRSIASWLGESTQANLEMYNPIVMSKMFFLNDAQTLNIFQTDKYVWIDAGITNTVHWGYFTHDKVLYNLEEYLQKFLMVSFPYSNYEIHGFPEAQMREYANVDKISYVCRGGIFGGEREYIRKVNEIYYGLLADTLSRGLMGTEESVFTIIANKYSDLIDRAEIKEDGLLGTFFENLKNKTVNLVGINRIRPLESIKTNLYVISFNSPTQFRVLCEGYAKEKHFFTHSTRYLLDNSTDLTTTPEYLEVCKEYGFTHIKKDNLGICGGRQFIAEHFDQTGADYYIFLEDDMNINHSDMGLCKNGFTKYVDNLYEKVHKICELNRYDFLKFCFTEFYGDNSTQWAWYNVPKDYRAAIFPEKPYLPTQGLDPNAPKTKFNNICSIDGLPYADGEVYYCNWPQLVSRDGNKKMFLTEKWAHPFEQTWMSYIYQETKKGNIRGAVLLATPVTHYRFHHYDSSARKES